MAQVRHNQTNFTAGEVSPLIFARVDIDRYANGAKEIYNYLVQPFGGATRRQGTYYVAAAKNANVSCRLVPFKVSGQVAYVIEIGNGYARFHRDRATIGGGTPLEIVLPYVQADLDALRFAQSGDTLFIAHQSYPPRFIKRVSATEFNTGLVEFSNGPWDSENTSDVTMAPSAASTTGTITMTASAAAFTADDVGRFIALYNDCQERAASTAYAKDAVFFADDRGIRRVYRVVKAGTSEATDMAGTTPDYDQNMPNEEGAYIKDGTARLMYIGRGKSAWGWGVITVFTSSTVVSVLVKNVFSSGIPDPTSEPPENNSYPNPTESTSFASTTATVRWKLGAWCVTNGYPGTVCFFQQRMWWGGSTGSPQTVWSSQSGDFYNMAPTEPDGAVLDTNAIVFALDDDESNQILWLMPVFKGVAVGTASGEFLLGPTSSANQAVSPTNFYARRASDRGSDATASARRVASSALFVQRGGRRIRELQYDLATDGYQTPTVNLISEHITSTGVVDLALQEEPDGTVWVVRDDGILASMAYDKEETVRGWARQEISGGTVESMAIVPSPALAGETQSTTDEIYLCVQRVINSATVRYIEVLLPPYREMINGENGGFFVDCGLTYDGAPTTTFTGLGHLEGETVQICANGAYRGTAMVSSGSVSISTPAASLAHIGLGYQSRLEPLPLEAGAQGGTAQTVMKKTTDCYVYLFETRGGELGINGDYERIQTRAPSNPVNEALPLYTGLHRVAGGGVPLWWDREGGVVIRQTEPLPMTVLSLVRTVTVNG